MGKTHGPTSHTRYINPKILKILQNKRDPAISTSHGPSIFDQPVKVPKMVKHDQCSLKTWSRANSVAATSLLRYSYHNLSKLFSVLQFYSFNLFYLFNRIYCSLDICCCSLYICVIVFSILFISFRS
jgi:hypothetical protein